MFIPGQVFPHSKFPASEAAKMQAELGLATARQAEDLVVLTTVCSSTSIHWRFGLVWNARNSSKMLKHVETG